MSKLPALHVHMEGLTAFFKHPLTIAGTQISLPCPLYSTLLGLLSACAGREITHLETKMGFEFHCSSRDIELERTDRLALEKKMLTPHREGQGILKRYVYFNPVLDLYVTNLAFEEIFRRPVLTPSLGRSQDIMWITNIEKVELNPISAGKIGPTLLPDTLENIPSLIVRGPEWFENNHEGRTRIAGPFGRYQALLPTSQERFNVSLNGLYHPSNLDNPEDAIYLHEWLEEKR